MNHAPILIVGAGPTGLSAAFHVGPDALLVERESRVGGACRSVFVNGFTFDLAPHIMFSNDPYVHELYTVLLRDNVHWQEREGSILGRDTKARFGYPLRGGFQALMDAFLRTFRGKSGWVPRRPGSRPGITRWSSRTDPRSPMTL